MELGSPKVCAPHVLHTLVDEKCGWWILFTYKCFFFFSFFGSIQVHTKFHCRQAHAVGSDTSCLTFSYDGTTLASRGGKICSTSGVSNLIRKGSGVGAGLRPSRAGGAPDPTCLIG